MLPRPRAAAISAYQDSMPVYQVSLAPTTAIPAAVAATRQPLGDADGARKAAVTEAPQFAIDQMVGDQAGIVIPLTSRS